MRLTYFKIGIAMNELSIEVLCQPLSATVMPHAAKVGMNGQIITDAEAMRNQRGGQRGSIVKADKVK